jgi:hypothetical protein
MQCLLELCIGILVATATAFSTPPSSSHSHHGLRLAFDDSSFDMSELSRRIEGLQTAEKFLEDNSEVQSLPAVAFDALLPHQRIAGRTTDRTFGKFLASLGLGGMFAMVSVNHAKRKLRRNGVICRIELCDAPASGLSANGRRMTAVDFQVVALQRCRLLGPPSGMKARVGRWRRQYCPDGEGSKLGFGMETFLDVEDVVASYDPDLERTDARDDKNLPSKMWTKVPVDCQLEEDVDEDDEEVIEKAKSIVPLLEKWQKLASDVKTYENTDVVAASRVMKGQPGLHVDPAALLRKVLSDLGEQPDPATNPTDFALWGAALINPLPALGVSPEIRGRVLEAPNARMRLEILEWGVKRSIANLEGKTPL